MAGYNRTVLVGNLTRDPEHKQLSSGQSVCRLGLAINRQYKNRQTSEFVQEVCFIDIDVWGAQAESCSQYLQKGRQVLIEGRLKLNTWEDQNGQTRSKHSVVAERVVFLSTAPSDEISTNMQGAQAPQSDLEKELMDQLDQIKAKEEQKTKPAMKVATTPRKKVAKEVETEKTAESADISTGKSGEIDFKDEQPFTEDLPF